MIGTDANDDLKHSLQCFNIEELYSELLSPPLSLSVSLSLSLSLCLVLIPTTSVLLGVIQLQINL